MPAMSPVSLPPAAFEAAESPGPGMGDLVGDRVGYIVSPGTVGPMVGALVGGSVGVVTGDGIGALVGLGTGAGQGQSGQPQ